MKKMLRTCIAVGVLFALFSLDVSADYKGFNITAGSSWVKDETANPKNNNEYLMGIKWTSSGASSHKEWFQCVNSNLEQKAIGLLSSPSSSVKYLETTAKNGYYYYLRARREHIINPRTQVKGTWQP